jgi:phage baseplate assembly protein W|tara:strand:+ start:270 stop:686 length:417 start_codon:yes stop_codon:yes gene_type:complete
MVDLVNNGKTVATKDIYSDLDLFFRKHPITGDVVKKTDTDAIKRSVRNIVLTNKFERPFKPNFGGSIRQLLFELNTDRQINRVKTTLAKEIMQLEPRVDNVVVVMTDTDNNSVNMTVAYNIKNGRPNQEVEIKVTRTR